MRRRRKGSPAVGGGIHGGGGGGEAGKSERRWPRARGDAKLLGFKDVVGPYLLSMGGPDCAAQKIGWAPLRVY